MINVAFLLLIFFMLAGRLLYFDPLSVEPPVSRAGVDERSHDLLVTMSEDGRIALNDRIVSDEELIEAIEQARESGGAERVRLKADANLEAVRVVELTEVLSRAGIRSVSLLTTPEYE